jgi:T-complex protein 1 subunit eta
VEVVRTTLGISHLYLGPRGMDKMITDKSTTITNDGATILKLLNIVHPAARCLVDIAKSQVILTKTPKN